MPAIDALRLVLEPMPGVVLAVLFGSAARNRAGRESDLDVGLILDEGQAPAARIAVALERATGRTVDLVRLDQAPPLLRFEIARTGQVIIERRPHAWSDFRARAMVDWWDWAPTARMLHEAAAARVRQGATPGAHDGPA
jgi:hypothetical protein